jgi:hypothetical protein
MKFIIFLLIFGGISTCLHANDLKIKGEMSHNLKNTQKILIAEYKVIFYQTKLKNFAIVGGGNVSYDYDIFGKTQKVFGFTHIGIEW